MLLKKSIHYYKTRARQDILVKKKKSMPRLNLQTTLTLTSQTFQVMFLIQIRTNQLADPKSSSKKRKNIEKRV